MYISKLYTYMGSHKKKITIGSVRYEIRIIRIFKNFKLIHAPIFVIEIPLVELSNKFHELFFRMLEIRLRFVGLAYGKIIREEYSWIVESFHFSWILSLQLQKHTQSYNTL